MADNNYLEKDLDKDSNSVEVEISEVESLKMQLSMQKFNNAQLLFEKQRNDLGKELAEVYEAHSPGDDVEFNGLDTERNVLIYKKK